MKNLNRYIPGLSCPACYETSNEKMLFAEEVRNASSRFCEASICSACGVEEAFRGFFWREKALQRGFKLKPGAYEIHDGSKI
jgi:Zn ribbon nucleic-acid-binding protein